MTQTKLFDELKKLTCSERLAVVETALRLIRKDLQQTNQSLTKMGRNQKLAKAAKALLPDYQVGGELTTFTVLDSEDFCAKG